MITEEQLSALYAAYLEFKADGTRSLLGDTTDEKSAENIRWVTRAMPKDLFFDLTRGLHTSDPDKFKGLVVLLNTGWTEPGEAEIPQELLDGSMERPDAFTILKTIVEHNLNRPGNGGPARS